MTVAATLTAVQYTGNGSATQYTFNNKIFQASDLVVTLFDLNGAQYNFPNQANAGLALSYTVQNVDVDTGCLVVFNSPPALNWTIDIRTAIPETQPTSIKNQGAFLPELHEEGFDRVTREIQDLRRLSYLFGIHGPDTEVIPWPALPGTAGRKGMALMFDPLSGLPTLGVPNTQTITTGLLAPFLGLAQTNAEIAAGVTPTNAAYAPGDVRRYGAVGDGVTDDYIAFSRAALVSNIHAMTIYATSNGYLINANTLSLISGSAVVGIGRPLLKCTVAGQPIMAGSALATVTVSGIRFQGLNSTTVPTVGYGGFSPANTGILSIDGSTDVRVYDCEVTTFYNGLTLQNCRRLWVQGCRVTHWTGTGILIGSSTEFSVAQNDIVGCDQASGIVAYGVQATGNQAGGQTQKRNQICYNEIADIPSWDAIGSHDCDGLEIIGNDIRNVRNGIDMGHLVNTNIVKNIIIAGNYIEATTINSWGATAASHFGIAAVGYDATHRMSRVVISGNIVNGFFNIAGMVGGGLPNNIVVSNCDRATVGDNIVDGVGASWSNAGIYLNGTVNGCTITGNTLNGTMSKGAIRFESATVDAVSITGNNAQQTNPSTDSTFVSTASTGALSYIGNVGNSVQPISSSGGLTFSGQNLVNSIAQGVVTPSFGNPTAIDTGKGGKFIIVASSNIAFTISNPLSANTGASIVIFVKNTSGGVLGAVTFDTLYRLAGAWVSPATGNKRSITFSFDGTNWNEESRSAADIPN